MAENFLNLPTQETQKEIADALKKMANIATPQDFTGSPGSEYLMAGDKQNGFYGFVQPKEFGLITANPEGKKELTATNLATAIGLTGGTAINDTVAWMKFSRKGKVLFVPVMPLRHSVTWNQIYNAGAVYGDDSVGQTPPNGRAGKRLRVDAATNSFVMDTTEGEGFTKDGAVLGAIGDIIVTRGFANAANNGEFTIAAITNSAVTVTGGTLVTEPSAPKASIYRKTLAITQNRKVTIGDHTFRVRLLKGASQDPLNSFLDADRDMVGPESEWNSLILPLHEQAKLQNWAYKAHAGTTDDWKVGLTDQDLSTHHTLGLGSYTWCQETSDDLSHARVIRGYGGASHGSHYNSWFVNSSYGWRPCLELI